MDHNNSGADYKQPRLSDLAFKVISTMKEGQKVQIQEKQEDEEQEENRRGGGVNI